MSELVEVEWVTELDFLKTMLECKFYQKGDHVRQGETCGNEAVRGLEGKITEVFSKPHLGGDGPFLYDVDFRGYGACECSGKHFVAWRRPKA